MKASAGIICNTPVGDCVVMKRRILQRCTFNFFLTLPSHALFNCSTCKFYDKLRIPECNHIICSQIPDVRVAAISEGRLLNDNPYLVLYEVPLASRGTGR